MAAERGEIELFDRGGTPDELKARCLAETGLPAPTVPAEHEEHHHREHADHRCRNHEWVAENTTLAASIRAVASSEPAAPPLLASAEPIMSMDEAARPILRFGPSSAGTTKPGWWKSASAGTDQGY
jgi:hypothetical protein